VRSVLASCCSVLENVAIGCFPHAGAIWRNTRSHLRHADEPWSGFSISAAAARRDIFTHAGTAVASPSLLSACEAVGLCVAATLFQPSAKHAPIPRWRSCARQTRRRRSGAWERC
jgi:hypothetical protein